MTPADKINRSILLHLLFFKEDQLTVQFRTDADPRVLIRID